MTPEAQSKAARQRNELRAQAETIARLQREKMELLRDLRAAEAHNARADLAYRWSDDMDAAPKDGTRVLAYWPDVYGNGSATQVESWFGPRQASWEDACWQSAFEWDDGSNSPTHWMPLPAPPKEGE